MLKKLLTFETTVIGLLILIPAACLFWLFLAIASIEPDPINISITIFGVWLIYRGVKRLI